MSDGSELTNEEIESILAQGKEDYTAFKKNRQFEKMLKSWTGGNREKNNILRFIIIVFIAFVVGGAIGAIILRATNSSNSGGAEGYTARERQYLERIADYERREQTRLKEERARLEREGARIARTEEQLGTLRQLDRRSSDLFEELAIEAGILQDYFYYSRCEHFDAVGGVNNSEISP